MQLRPPHWIPLALQAKRQDREHLKESIDSYAPQGWGAPEKRTKLYQVQLTGGPMAWLTHTVEYIGAHAPAGSRASSRDTIFKVRDAEWLLAVE